MSDFQNNKIKPKDVVTKLPVGNKSGNHKIALFEDDGKKRHKLR